MNANSLPCIDPVRLNRPWRRWISRKHKSIPSDQFVDLVQGQGAHLEKLSTQQLLAYSEQLKKLARRSCKRDSDQETVNAFAAMREAIRRTTGKVYYPVQLLGGLALTRGSIAEMQTGEGKTLTTGLPAFTLGLLGYGVHIATTNTYLAHRDCEELRPALEMLGLTVGKLPEEKDPQVTQKAYQCDVTFGTGYDFGFDFLRDQIAQRGIPKARLGAQHMARITGRRSQDVLLLQRAHRFAIIDEADSVLIDEATMPLILSVPTSASESEELLQLAAATADQLVPEEHYTLDVSKRTLTFTDEAWKFLHAPLYRMSHQNLQRPWSTYVEQSLRAKHFLTRDVDYIVSDQEVQIVDQLTGRIHPERTWRDGLHQAVEIREGLPVSQEKKSAGSVSRQRYFQFYDRLCGMTGTATDNEAEFQKFYGLDVVEIPTNRPSQRQVLPNRFFSDSDSRDLAILHDVTSRHRTGQPILIGTRTIRHSLQLAQRLDQAGIRHALLNGVQDQDESQIIARAGEFGGITIATNMAGRGTDIKPDTNALQVGGLHVIGAEHNTSRRIDRQLAGRSARQGNPGSVQFFASADDELFVIGKSDLPERIRDSADRSGESQQSFKESLRRLQDQIEQEHFAGRRQMVYRDNWMENVMEQLSARNKINYAK